MVVRGRFEQSLVTVMPCSIKCPYTDSNEGVCFVIVVTQWEPMHMLAHFQYKETKALTDFLYLPTLEMQG